MINVKAAQTSGEEHSVHFNVKPDICPRCHHAIDPTQTSARGVTGNPSEVRTILEVVYRCPRHTCGQFFIGRYQKPSYQGRTLKDSFELKVVTPRARQEPALPSEIVEVSPMFKTIYAQAAEAEDYGLDQIAGAGFRKALEFLVKDYCIKQNPDDADAVRREFLGNTISSRVSDPNVKACAKRATWLGNDETHYERRWEGKDLTDLKTLIALTMNWISTSVLTKRYLAEMPEVEK